MTALATQSAFLNRLGARERAGGGGWPGRGRALRSRIEAQPRSALDAAGAAIAAMDHPADGSGITLEARPVRGVVSNGMLCSGAELELDVAPAELGDHVEMMGVIHVIEVIGMDGQNRTKVERAEPFVVERIQQRKIFR